MILLGFKPFQQGPPKKKYIWGMYSVQYKIYDTYENVLDFCFPDSRKR